MNFVFKSLSLCLFLLLIGGTSDLMAQKKRVELIGADELAFHKQISGAQRLIGNVRFKYGETRMFCDSAWYYPDEDFFDAWGNIRVVGESEKIFGDSLHIDREQQIAKLRGNVRLTDGEMNLKTNIVHYDLSSNVASYYGGGDIVSTKNNDKLSSQEGFYDTESRFFHFRRDVVLKNPEYTIYSDTLKYAGYAEKAWFLGPTRIVSANSEIYCENGWYESGSQNSQFSKNVVITSGSSILKGDTINYSGETAIGEVFCNVFIQDTTNNYIITGDYGWYNENTSESLVTERALMIQDFDTDSLFLHADTLRSNVDSLNNNVIRAYHNVKFFKSDLQGKADSLIYLESDSILTFFNNPVLWSVDNQIVGDTISVNMSNDKIDELIVDQNGFIIAKVDSVNFNQIKGRELTGKFVENELRRLYVEGNVEVVYFPVTDKDNEVVGYNKVECSNLTLELKDSEIRRIKIIKESDGALHPMSKISFEERLLKNFNWRGEERPRHRGEVFLK